MIAKRSAFARFNLPSSAQVAAQRRILSLTAAPRRIPRRPGAGRWPGPAPRPSGPWPVTPACECFGNQIALWRSSKRPRLLRWRGCSRQPMRCVAVSGANNCTVPHFNILRSPQTRVNCIGQWLEWCPTWGTSFSVRGERRRLKHLTLIWRPD